MPDRNRFNVNLLRGALAAIMLPIAAAAICQAEGANPVRPFGELAPWNVPVAALAKHEDSEVYRVRLWQDAPDRPGNFNLSFEDYTYPVYDARDAAGLFEVRAGSGSMLDKTLIPWNPRWLPATGSDGQVIVLDTVHGIEWDLWQVSFDGTRLHASNGSRVPGDYRRRETGHPPSRGAGIPYLAMLVRPGEVEKGRIEHALSMAIRNTDGDAFVPPATKLEHPGKIKNGIPEGMRFALAVTDAEIDTWLRSLPRSLPEATRRSARVIAVALRDYGWFITDSSGGAHLQFESRLTAGEAWRSLGLGPSASGFQEFPRDLLDGLLKLHNIYALVPSDVYPEDLRSRPLQ